MNLTIEAVRKIVNSLFEINPKWNRSDIVKEVERIHLASGGVIFTKSTTSSVKKVLADMKNKKLIANIGKGLWVVDDISMEMNINDSLSPARTIGIPLQPVYARKLILKLLEEKPTWQRSELSRRLQSDHIGAGNELGTQDPLVVTKKALTYLQDAGYVESDGRGNWSLKTNSQSETETASFENSTAELDIEEANSSVSLTDGLVVLGEGAESVYMYYYATEKELALLKGKATWQCKIGRTRGDVTLRIFSQAKTSRSKPPIIAVIIRSDYAAYLEQVIHNSLKMNDRHIDPEGGDVGIEWFDTNPDKLIAWWKGYAKLQAYFL